MIYITTTLNQPRPENAGARPSAPSASSAPALNPRSVNGFAFPDLRTVAHDEDGVNGSVVPTVCTNPLKSNAGADADGADANRLPQSAPEEAGASGRRARL
jgi:hypothetical protein